MMAVLLLQVSVKSEDLLFGLKLTDLWAEQQSNSKEPVESHTDPDGGSRTI